MRVLTHRGGQSASHALALHASLERASNGREPALFRAHCHRARCIRLATAPRSAVLAYSPDSRHLAQVTRQESVVIWDVLSGEIVGRIPASQGAITAVAFSPDGAVLATTGADTTTLLWDVASVCKPSALQKGMQCP